MSVSVWSPKLLEMTSAQRKRLLIVALAASAALGIIVAVLDTVLRRGM